MIFPCVTKVEKVMKVMRILGQFYRACRRPMDAIFFNSVYLFDCDISDKNHLS